MEVKQSSKYWIYRYVNEDIMDYDNRYVNMTRESHL